MKRRFLLLAVVVVVGLAAFFVLSRRTKDGNEVAKPANVAAPESTAGANTSAAASTSDSGRIPVAPVSPLQQPNSSGQRTPRMPVDPTLNVSPSS